MFGIRRRATSIAQMKLSDSTSAVISVGATVGLVGTLFLYRSIGISAMAASVGATGVSSISDSIQSSLPKLYDIPLIPILDYENDAITGKVTAKVDEPTTLRQAAQSVGTPNAPSVCFIIRRPGCVLCREHGLQLVQMHKEKAEVPFYLWGIVKEIGVDDLGLKEFHTTYFHKLPLYHDPQNAIYDAFGRRSILKLRTWNPISIYRGFVDIGRRLSSQNISGNYKGEGIIQGGILIFDSTGTLRHSINEEIGQPLDLDAIYQALQDVTSNEKLASSESDAPNSKIDSATASSVTSEL